VAIPKLLKAWEFHNRAVLQSQRMLMARQMISCHSFRGQNMTWPAATGILTLAASFNEWPNQGGLHKKLQQLVFRQMRLPAWFEIEALH
jgi:hypothetical protein